MRNKLIFLLFISVSVICILEACQSEQELNYARYYMNGKEIYEGHCQNCHGDSGQGLAQLYPPLTDTSYLKTNKSELACIIKNGLKGPISVNGIEFNGEMPSESHLANIDIAAVITYITNSFGNKQGLYDVANAEADLKACQH
ncbi:c-type cytochrome [Paradesertivirga mongoliensis]|uniref:C-type cytochrome n=1 Tax=Paradesertivirga mongoliensis TaxID=2100740 RepID=A0ABW4ZQ46_9SPHI|nr:cytochrome c [Pedobacter mongoliensis]